MADTGRKAGRRSKRTLVSPDEERSYLRQAVGVVVLIGAVLMAAPTLRTAYRWLNRSAHSKVDVEVLTEPARTPRRIRVLVLSDQAELWVEPLDFEELQTGGTVSTAKASQGQRFQAWYNPGAASLLFDRRFVLFDQRLIPTGSHPEVASGTEALCLLAVTAGLVAGGAFLFTAPGRKRR